uniref:DUF4129 domain-containing transglutaminase family protein n=1 Tax=Candidatus Enterococcus willemsii TaxID=1857215 RepID=UPI00403F2E72
MMRRLQRKLPLLFLSFISFSVLFTQFLTTYQVSVTGFSFFAIALLCVVALLRYRLLKFPVYLLSGSWIFYQYVRLEQTFSLSWFRTAGQLIQSEIARFLTGEMSFIPLEVALVILLLLLILLTELQIEYERIYLSTLVIIVYMLLIATFNRVDVSYKIILLLAVALIMRLLIVAKQEYQRVIYGSVLVIGLVIGASLLPITSIRDELVIRSARIRNHLNQTGFYQLFEEGASGTRTGFGENDAVLGGPLMDDHTLLFEAKQQTAHYWRVESKEVYTGTGWRNSSSYNESIYEESGGRIYLEDEAYLGEYQPRESIELSFSLNDSYLPLPYGRVILESEADFLKLERSHENGRLNYASASDRTNLTIDWFQPDYTQATLAGVTNQEIEHYLSLPILPERVVTLAEDLTADKPTLLEKVLAVEEYLKNSSDFRYSKIDTPVTPKGRDYVDHFLFDSQVGYCDNFSTAMAVLLRVVDIPTRWAKGFAPGEVVREEDGHDVYAIRNSDAHSWVEVFFDGVGWVPFEPTPSFSQALDSTVATSDSSETSETSQSTEESSTSSSSTELSTSNESTSATDEPTTTNHFWEPMIQLFKNSWRYLRWLILAVCVLSLWRWGVTWQILILWRFSKQSLIRVYPRLLKQIEKRQERPAEQTLHAYAERVEANFPIFDGDFRTLTQNYEAALYASATIETQEIDYPFIKKLLAKIRKMNKNSI